MREMIAYIERSQGNRAKLLEMAGNMFFGSAFSTKPKTEMGQMEYHLVQYLRAHLPHPFRNKEKREQWVVKLESKIDDINNFLPKKADELNEKYSEDSLERTCHQLTDKIETNEDVLAYILKQQEEVRQNIKNYAELYGNERKEEYRRLEEKNKILDRLLDKDITIMGAESEQAFSDLKLVYTAYESSQNVSIFHNLLLTSFADAKNYVEDMKAAMLKIVDPLDAPENADSLKVLYERMRGVFGQISDISKKREAYIGLKEKAASDLAKCPKAELAAQ